MVTLSNAETELIRQLIDCLAEAMHSIDDIDIDYSNKTKVQKLLYLAIEEFDIPISYSWYLAGSIVESDTVAPSTVKTAFDDLPSPDSPTISEASPEVEELDDDDDPDDVPTDDDQPLPPVLFEADFGHSAIREQSPDIDDQLSKYVDPDEVVDFYTSVLPEVWFQQTMRFLQNFYLTHAPPKYRDLYLVSIQLRTNLSEFESAIEAAVAGDSHHRSRDEIVHAIELQISDLHLELANIDALSDTFDAVVEGTDLLEHALITLASVDDSDLTKQHIGLVEDLIDFLYYSVWRYPCLIISHDTATGPSEEEIKARRRDQLQTFEAELDRHREDLRHQLEELSLSKSTVSEPLDEGEIIDRLSDLSEEYLQR